MRCRARHGSADSEDACPADPSTAVSKSPGRERRGGSGRWRVPPLPSPPGNSPFVWDSAARDGDSGGVRVIVLVKATHVKTDQVSFLDPVAGRRGDIGEALRGPPDAGENRLGALFGENGIINMGDFRLDGAFADEG